MATDTSDASEELPTSLEIAGAIRMGEPPPSALRHYTALPVATGGALPAAPTPS